MTSTTLHSKRPSAPQPLRVRQRRSVTRGLDAERFIWDGLALVHRDGSDYLNEPSIGGGNPVASNGKVMLNDRLGNTVAVKNDEAYCTTSMTAFGESTDSGAFFTGKPFVGELGYAFLMRSYRPENGKWQSTDPLGYPDGWNQLAYCNNGVTSSVDLWGCIEFMFDGDTDFSSSSGNVLNQNTYYRISLTDSLTSHTADTWSSSISLGLYAESHLQTGMLDGSGSMVYTNSGSARTWNTTLTYQSTGNDTYNSSGSNGLYQTITSPFRIGYSFDATYDESIAWNKDPSEDGYKYGTMSLTFSAGSATFGDKKTS